MTETNGSWIMSPPSGFPQGDEVSTVSLLTRTLTLSSAVVRLDPLDEPSVKYLSKLSVGADYALGSYMVVLSMLTVLLNLLVLITMWRQTQALSPVEIYVANLAVVDLCPALLEYPLTSTSAYLHGWAFGDIGCMLCASVVYFFGIASISTVTLMSVMRYVKTCHSATAGSAITRRFVYISLVPIYANSLIWSVAPLLGWGSYAPEPHGNACTLDWRRLSVSYIICMFGFIYILPCALICFSYTRMVCILRSAQRSMRTVSNRKDIYLAKMTLAMTTSFMVAWTPYTILAFYYILADYKDVPLVLTVIAPYLAKTSTLYNPVVYFLAVKRFRDDVKRLLLDFFGCKERVRSSRFCTMGGRSQSTDEYKDKSQTGIDNPIQETVEVEIEMSYQTPVGRSYVMDTLAESNVALLAPEEQNPGNESNNNNNNNHNNHTETTGTSGLVENGRLYS